MDHNLDNHPYVGLRIFKFSRVWDSRYLPPGLFVLRSNSWCFGLDALAASK